MKNFFLYTIFIFCLINSTFLYSQTIPSAIPGLEAWFAADSLKVGNGNPIDTLKAINNEFKYVSQPTATNRPVLVTNVINGKPIMRFDGINDYLDGGDILDIGTNGQTVFIVSKSNTATGCFYAKSYYGDKTKRYGLVYSSSNLAYWYHPNILFTLTGQNNLNSFELITTNANIPTGKIILYQNSIKQTQAIVPANYNMNSYYNFLIGAYNNASGLVPPVDGYYLNGDIAEIIIFNRSLSQLERQEIENYLRLKYFPGTERLQLSLGADINSPYGFAPITLTVPPQAYYVSYEWNTGATTSTINVDTSGAYSVKVIDNWGYEYYDTITVTKPQITPQANAIVCDGDTLIWDCGLSGAYTYVWNTGETTQSIKISAEGDYSVTVKDSFNNTQTSKTATITIDDFSTSANLGADTALCEGNIIELATRKVDAIDYIWNTGETTSEIIFNAAGEYSVIATNANGCKAYDTVVISLKGIAPIVEFSSTNICDGNITTLQEEAYTTDGSNITGTTWYIYNDTLVGSQVTYEFPSHGTHPIRVSVSNELNCYGILNSNVQIFPTPVINFVPPKGCANGETIFKSTSTIASGTLDSYLWTIEGESFINDSVSYIFSNPGTYPISLSAQSNNGCNSSLTKNIVIRDASLIQFVSSKTCKNESVYFFDKTEYTAYNTVVDGNWIIDGQEYPYNTTIGKLFTDTNFHIIKLQVKTINGCNNYQIDTIKIYPSPQVIIPPIYGCINKEFKIQDASNTFGNIINSYVWIIDSTEYKEPEPMVEFKDTGNYPISLVIETEHECVQSSTGTIRIETPPTANFTFSPEFGATPLIVDFTNTSEGAETYKWRFELNSIFTDENPTYTFTDKLNSYATLYAYSPNFCVDSIIKHIPIQLADAQIEIIDYIIAPTNSGYVSYQVQVLNTGNAPINLIEFVLENPEFPAISETWRGELPVEEVLTYTFTSTTKANEKEQLPYICISANLTTAHEYKIYFSDSKCKDFTGDFGIYRISPNPASDKSIVKFNTTITGTVELMCVDQSGKIFEMYEFPNLEPGYHSKTIDATSMPAGTYLCKIKQNNQTDTHYFIVRK